MTHFVEVLIFHGDSTEGSTGADKFILQSSLLVGADLKVIDGFKCATAKGEYGGSLKENIIYLHECVVCYPLAL